MISSSRSPSETASGVPPEVATRSTAWRNSAGVLIETPGEALQDRVDRAFADSAAVDVDAGDAGLGGKGNDGRTRRVKLRLGDSIVILGDRDDRTALRRLVGETRHERRLGELLGGHAGHGQELGRHAIAECDRARLVEQQRVDVACRLDRATGGRDHVEADQPVHARYANGGQEAADRRRNQADEQRDQHRRREGGAGITRQRPQRDADDKEDQRQAREQDRQRQLVRRLLPPRAFDQRNHPVDEGRPRGGSDPHL